MKPQASTNCRKYQTKNPVKRWLLDRFFSRVDSVLSTISARTLLDSGCGEGMAVRRLSSHWTDTKVTGVDSSAAAIAIAKKNYPNGTFRVMDVTKLSFPDRSFDLVTMMEVLEHIPDPVRALKEAKRVSRKWCLFSVPHEPWFSILSLLSGQYVKRLGMHPEHVNFWTAGRFVSFVRPHFSSVTYIPGFPWTIVLCTK